ncbi:MAG: hypothetical protein P8J27_17185 [Mariniblastus sp.]|nr:hypothetical protein [Mariniblastus sp.]
MYFSRTIFPLNVLFLLCLVLGCGGESAVDSLQSAYDAMKGPTADLENAFASIVDEASAKKALPKLKAAEKKMIDFSAAFEKAMATNSRNAIALKKEINDYRDAQKKAINEHLMRVKNLADANKVLAEFMEKFDVKL